MYCLGQPRVRKASKLVLDVLLALALSVAVGAAHTGATPGELPQPASGAIHGAVTMLGQQTERSPLEGIRVELTESCQDCQLLSTLTDSAGHFEFTQLPAGTYTLRVNQQGFKPFAETISLNVNQTSVVDLPLALHPAVTKLQLH